MYNLKNQDGEEIIISIVNEIAQQKMTEDNIDHDDWPDYEAEYQEAILENIKEKLGF